MAATWTPEPADRDQPAARVLALVLDSLLDEMLAHEPGVRADADPEELHDYRVALRRARSVVAAGRDIYPSEERELLAALLRWLAGVTSPVRDLDVLLEDLPDLADRLAPELADGTGDLRSALVARRFAARRELGLALDGDRYRVLLRRWRLLGSVHRIGGSEPGPDALRTAGEVADALILRAYRRARKAGRRARATDDRAEWHELRKALKRYRYLVAAFSGLYPEGTFAPVQKRLSRLQDLLGRLQDHHVQASLLEEVGVDHGGRAALAAGALADALHRDAEKAHARCRDAWVHFDTPGLRRRMDDLLGPGS